MIRGQGRSATAVHKGPEVTPCGLRGSAVCSTVWRAGAREATDDRGWSLNRARAQGIKLGPKFKDVDLETAQLLMESEGYSIRR